MRYSAPPPGPRLEFDRWCRVLTAELRRYLPTVSARPPTATIASYGATTGSSSIRASAASKTSSKTTPSGVDPCRRGYLRCLFVRPVECLDMHSLDEFQALVQADAREVAERSLRHRFGQLSNTRILSVLRPAAAKVETTTSGRYKSA